MAHSSSLSLNDNFAEFLYREVETGPYRSAGGRRSGRVEEAVKSYRLTPAAQRDISAIRDFTQHHRNATQAEIYSSKMTAAISGSRLILIAGALPMTFVG